MSTSLSSLISSTGTSVLSPSVVVSWFDPSALESPAPCLGTSFERNWSAFLSSASVKLNKGGSGVLDGSIQSGSRNSSKNSCAINSKQVGRALGVY